VPGLLYQLGTQDLRDLAAQDSGVVNRGLPDKGPRLSQRLCTLAGGGVGKSADAARTSACAMSRRIDQPGLGQHAGPDERLQRGLDRQIHAAAEQGG
jgi:hypothetical protein